jgi:hypothetical protein
MAEIDRLREHLSGFNANYVIIGTDPISTKAIAKAMGVVEV